MTVYKSQRPEGVVLVARGETEGAVGDLAVLVRPGESAFGLTYSEWLAREDGPYEVEA